MRLRAGIPEIRIKGIIFNAAGIIISVAKWLESI
jgi:hypothetical protein